MIYYIDMYCAFCQVELLFHSCCFFTRVIMSLLFSRGMLFKSDYIEFKVAKCYITVLRMLIGLSLKGKAVFSHEIT